MAERRYGFRFSFAEGCVIVVSMIGASFLVFLFGIYAGRELEARKTVENTRTMRVNNTPNERMSDAQLEGIEGAAVVKEKDKSENVPYSSLEIPKTVVVVAPQKPTERTAPALIPPPPPPLPEKETQGQVELLPKTPPILASKEEQPSLPSVRVAQETKPASEAKPVALSQKGSAPKGRWSVQVHATRDEGAARRLANQLRSQGYTPVVSKSTRDGDVWYRVRVGSFASVDEARASVGRFRREGKFSQAYPVSN